MALVRALLYLAAFVLLLVAAFNPLRRGTFALLAAAAALLAFALPDIAAGF